MHVTNQELTVVIASRLFREGEVVFVGVGVPNLAANLAKRIRTPNLVMIYETGIVGAKPFRMPLSVGDAGITANSQCIVGALEIFTWFLQGGRIDVGFLGGAQVDRWGNLNSTVIGGYDNPSVRLPGSGGAGDVASMAKRTILIMPHERRRFPASVDFITSPGYVEGRRGRKALGLPGAGPELVITNLGVLGFDDAGEMELRSVHPGVTIERVRRETGWPLKIARNIGETEAPTEEELQVLRALQREQFGVSNERAARTDSVGQA